MMDIFCKRFIPKSTENKIIIPPIGMISYFL